MLFWMLSTLLFMGYHITIAFSNWSISTTVSPVQTIDYSKDSIIVVDSVFRLKTTHIENSGFSSNPYLFVDLYPNPVSSKLNVRIFGIYSIGQGAGTVSLVNICGQNVLDLTENYQRNSNGKWSFFDVDVRNLPVGVYFLVFQTPTGAVSERFIVIK